MGRRARQKRERRLWERITPTPKERALLSVVTQQAVPEDACLLCGRLTRGVILYTPDDAQAFGAAPGVERHLLYRLCAVCRERPESVPAAQQLLRTQIEQGARQVQELGPGVTLHRYYSSND
jgi:hypothetical protein